MLWDYRDLWIPDSYFSLVCRMCQSWFPFGDSLFVNLLIRDYIKIHIWWKILKCHWNFHFSVYTFLIEVDSAAFNPMLMAISTAVLASAEQSEFWLEIMLRVLCLVFPWFCSHSLSCSRTLVRFGAHGMSLYRLLKLPLFQCQFVEDYVHSQDLLLEQMPTKWLLKKIKFQSPWIVLLILYSVQEPDSCLHYDCKQLPFWGENNNKRA